MHPNQQPPQPFPPRSDEELDPRFVPAVPPQFDIPAQENPSSLPMPEYQPESLASSRPVENYQQPVNEQLPPVDTNYQPNSFRPNTYASSSLNRPTPAQIPTSIPQISNDQTISKTKKTVQIVGFIVAVLLIILIGWLLWSNLRSTGQDSGAPAVSDQFPEPSASQTPAKAVTANSLDDLAAVCNSSAVTNAPAYAAGSISPVGLFAETNSNQYAVSDITLEQPTLVASNSNYTAVQTVGCLTRESVVDTGINCNFEDADTKKSRSLDLYSVNYKLYIYEAKTAKQLSANNVDSLDSKCPLEAKISKSDPKLYTDANPSQVNQIISERAD